MNILSHASFYTEQLDFSKKITGHASSFIYKFDNEHYLITNWHVITGKNAETGIFFKKNGSVPCYLRIYYYDKELKGYSKTIRLYQNEIHTWLEHPNNSGKYPKIDVIAIKIKKDEKLLSIQEALQPHNENTKEYIADDVFILGHPFTNDGKNNYLPIWKKGSIASEPEVYINNSPIIYVDTATRNGMSGAPVIINKKRAVFVGTRQAIETGKNISTHFQKIVGIYSSRYPKLSVMQFGIVWDIPVLEEIMNEKKKSNKK